MAEEEERILTIPLRDVQRAPRTKRAPAAIKLIKEFVKQHMKAKEENVWIDPLVSEFLWSRGIKNPPRKIKVKVIKFEDELVEVSLPGD